MPLAGRERLWLTPWLSPERLDLVILQSYPYSSNPSTWKGSIVCALISQTVRIYFTMYRSNEVSWHSHGIVSYFDKWLVLSSVLFFKVHHVEKSFHGWIISTIETLQILSFHSSINVHLSYFLFWIVLLKKDSKIIHENKIKHMCTFLLQIHQI